MKTTVNVFDVNKQKRLGEFPISSLKKEYDKWRLQGYCISVDSDGDVCLDNEDDYDDGKYYEAQLKN